MPTLRRPDGGRPPARAGRAIALVGLLVSSLPLLSGCVSSSGFGPSSSQSVQASSSPAASSPEASSPSASGLAASGSAAGPAPGGTVTFPVTIQAANGPVTLATRPQRIVSLAPTLTEMLFAIGAGPQVTAVDDRSDFPTQAPRTKLSGFQPNVEAVAGYRPDLVVVSNDSGGLVAALTRLKLPVLLLPAPTTLDAAYAQEATLGTVTGNLAQARAVADATRQRIDAAVAAVPKRGTPLKVYHELDQTYFSVNSQTFLGDLYREFGLTNIADGATKPSGGYPQLSAEYVIASAPDLVVLADGKCCQQTPATVAKRPAFAALPAVRAGRVIAVDDDIASRWGPRVADLAEQVARALGAAH